MHDKKDKDEVTTNEERAQALADIISQIRPVPQDKGLTQGLPRDLSGFVKGGDVDFDGMVGLNHKMLFDGTMLASLREVYANQNLERMRAIQAMEHSDQMFHQRLDHWTFGINNLYGYGSELEATLGAKTGVQQDAVATALIREILVTGIKSLDTDTLKSLAEKVKDIK